MQGARAGVSLDLSSSLVMPMFEGILRTPPNHTSPLVRKILFRLASSTPSGVHVTHFEGFDLMSTDLWKVLVC